VLVLIDYAKNKLTVLLEEWRSNVTQKPLQVFFFQGFIEISTQLSQAELMKYVSGLQVLWRSISVVNLLTYMTGRTDYHSPLLRVAGVGLHIEEEEISPRDLSHLRYLFFSILLMPG